MHPTLNRTDATKPLRHFKRSYRQALRRLMSTGVYDVASPKVSLVRADRRYRTWKPKPIPKANAAIVYIMDVSGSMGDEQKEIVRAEIFWLDTWIQSHYRGARTVYLVHDAAAKEVDRDTFFRIRESGGTVISTAYEMAARVIEERFPAAEWNLYMFHFTDGENYSRQDSDKSSDILASRLLPSLNLFGYGQVEALGTRGDFLDVLRSRFGDDGRVALSRLADRDAIVDSIKTFLGRGR